MRLRCVPPPLLPLSGRPNREGEWGQVSTFNNWFFGWTGRCRFLTLTHFIVLPRRAQPLVPDRMESFRHAGWEFSRHAIGRNELKRPPDLEPRPSRRAPIPAVTFGLSP